MIIKRIEPLSVAKVMGVLYAVFGFFVGCLFGLVALVGGAATHNSGAPVFGAMFGVGAAIFLPFVYGALGFVITLIMAALYNVVARGVGGIEFEIEMQRAPSSPQSGV